MKRLTAAQCRGLAALGAADPQPCQTSNTTAPGLIHAGVAEYLHRVGLAHVNYDAWTGRSFPATITPAGRELLERLPQ